jgi:hypothetical protein
MRPVPVGVQPGTWLAFTCARCGGRIDQRTELALFDPQGQPFMAYYHERCAAELVAGAHQDGAQ